MMVRRRGAVFAKIAIDGLSRVTLVCVDLQVPLGELEGVLGHDLVEGVFAARLKLASTAVA